LEKKRKELNQYVSGIKRPLKNDEKFKKMGILK
jgi:hypothetical protein